MNKGLERAQEVPGQPPDRPHRAVDLVFRSVGERTHELSLSLAIQHVRPDRVFILQNIKPFSKAVDVMLDLDHHASHVVHMDADCLILEDLRPFLEDNDEAYVDCYVTDRFRGRIHCGVHITRLDVVQAMRSITPPAGDLALALRPESRLRNFALNHLGLEKRLKTFHILHDFFQWHHDVFAKYVLRELRSRTEYQRQRLEIAMAHWDNEPDSQVARLGVAYAQKTLPMGSDAREVESFIRTLSMDSSGAFARALTDTKLTSSIDLRNVTGAQAPMTNDDLTNLKFTSPKATHKVFGIGLSRTGTRSLTAALVHLGFDVVHYPTDAASFGAMCRGDGTFPLLEHFDGLTDITTIPFIEELDKRFPGSRFVLTVRDKKSWLASCEKHWTGRTPFEAIRDDGHRVHMEVRRFLRASVYGAYDFNAERFGRVYDQHLTRVRTYFEDRPDSLLELNIVAGEGYEKLAPFLKRKIPGLTFPHKGSGPSRTKQAPAETQPDPLANLEIDD